MRSASIAVLVGNSFGGAVALPTAVTAPDRVAALMLICSPPPRLQPSRGLQAAWEAEESALEAGDLEQAVSAVLEAWTLPGAPAAVRSRIAEMQRQAFVLQAAAGSLAEAEDPLEAHPEALRTLATPVLVVAGELDFADFLAGAETLASELPQARHVVMDGAGHLAPLDQPERFRELLLGYLAQTESWG
jgi:pimeloyl-ACP methyl ester carboxylesterase